jgi:4-hydroxybenzoate polyprenyltransferase
VVRLWLYLAEMHPPGPRLAAAALITFGTLGLRARVTGEPFTWLSAEAAASTACVFAFMLMLRLADELKDVDVDRELFPWRPLPAGRVGLRDIRIALAALTVLFVLLHAWSGGMGSALVTLGYAAAMSCWFFVPRLLRPRLLATLATHQPIVPLLLLHLVGFAAGARATALIVALFWSSLLAWELARKIRAPRDENAYVTYSRLFGPRGACALVLLVQLLGLAAGVALAATTAVSWRLVAAQSLATGLLGFAVARFLAHPDTRTSHLRPWAETATLLAAVGGAVA